jgi:hypothetical protein
LLDRAGGFFQVGDGGFQVELALAEDVAQVQERLGQPVGDGVVALDDALHASAQVCGEGAGVVDGAVDLRQGEGANVVDDGLELGGELVNGVEDLGVSAGLSDEDGVVR